MAGPEATPRRLPPQDLAAERGVLGGVLVHGTDVLAGLAATLRPEDFYDRRHGAIFTAMRELYDKGAPVDEITVTSRLSDTGQLEQVGGAAYLAELADIVLSPAHADHYARLVADKSLLRSFIVAAHQAIDQAHTQQGEPQEALEAAEKAIFAATQNRISQGYSHIRDVVNRAMDIIDQRRKRRDVVTGVSTGLSKLDELLNGLQPSDLIIVAGRPGMGKTAFALNLAATAAMKSSVPVAVFSLEMSKEQLVMRLLSGEAGVSGRKIRTGFINENQEMQQLTNAADRLFRAPIYIDDTPGITVLELRAKCRRLKQEAGLGLLMIDYLQLMKGSGRNDSREQEISDISRSLKALAKELDIPVIALSQLNRKVEDRPGSDKRPMLSDLRESGAIEQDADVIMFIYRKKVYKKKEDPVEEDDNLAEIIVGKQRNGPTGTAFVTFLDDQTKFVDRDTVHEFMD